MIWLLSVESERMQDERLETRKLLCDIPGPPFYVLFVWVWLCVGVCRFPTRMRNRYIYWSLARSLAIFPTDSLGTVGALRKANFAFNVATLVVSIGFVVFGFIVQGDSDSDPRKQQRATLPPCWGGGVLFSARPCTAHSRSHPPKLRPPPPSHADTHGHAAGSQGWATLIVLIVCVSAVATTVYGIVTKKRRMIILGYGRHICVGIAAFLAVDLAFERVVRAGVRIRPDFGCHF